MNENDFNPEPGNQTNYQSSQDTRRDYDYPSGDNSSAIDENEREDRDIPQEFPERKLHHGHANPSDNDNNEDYELDPDVEILDTDDESDGTYPDDEHAGPDGENEHRRNPDAG